MAKQSSRAVQHKVLPIKDDKTLHDVLDTLLNNFKYGRRNYTIFQLGKTTLLRVSDVLALRYDDVYDMDGNVKDDAYIHDKKTGKNNLVYLKPIELDLIKYKQWYDKEYADLNSEYLFPKPTNSDQHYTEHQFYKVMAKVGDLLNIDYLGTHTMRKTGAYIVYTQSNYDIGLVMTLLNHSSQDMTLRYLGLDVVSLRQKLDNINFNSFN